MAYEPTRYEVAIERNGTRELVAYIARKSRHGVRDLIIGNDAIIDTFRGHYTQYGKRADEGVHIETASGERVARIFLTGRTKRDARDMGELPRFEGGEA